MESLDPEDADKYLKRTSDFSPHKTFLNEISDEAVNSRKSSFVLRPFNPSCLSDPASTLYKSQIFAGITRLTPKDSPNITKKAAQKNRAALSLKSTY